MTKPFLSVEGLAQPFPMRGEHLTVFEIRLVRHRAWEFVCIIGHSGCGKSTILNILAGLDEAQRGRRHHGRDRGLGPVARPGVVFQNYSLLPWLSALRNVSFGVAARHRDWTQEPRCGSIRCKLPRDGRA
jgi:nitrate/nitrite transport system ATP-binding protein